MRVAVLLLLALLALAGVSCALGAAPAAAQASAAPKRVTPPQPGSRDGPDDVHVFLKQVVAGDAAGARVAEAEQRFASGHKRVMRGLSKLAARLAKPALLEVHTQAELEAEVDAPVLPIIDDTGSAVEIPRANLTQFKLKPAIDAALVQDASLARLEAEAEARKEAARAAHRHFIERMRARVAAVFGATHKPTMVQPALVPAVPAAPPAVPVAAAPAAVPVVAAPGAPTAPIVPAAAATPFVVTMGTVLRTTEPTAITVVAPPEMANAVPAQAATNVVIAPTGNATANATAAAPAVATVPVTAPSLLETEAEAEAEAELEAEAEAEAEVEADADSDAWVDAELTDAGSVLVDAELSALELQSGLEAEAPVIPIIDDTGSAVEVPRANLTQFKLKPAIDPTLVQDASVAKLEAEAEAHRTARATAVESMKQRIQAAWAAAHSGQGSLVQPLLVPFAPLSPPAVPTAAPASLLETEGGDCPTCANGSKRQSHPVQYNAGSDALIDRPLIEEQHKRVDYMLGEARSIKQRDLDDARTQLINSNGVREDVQQLFEKNQNQPLIPRD